MKNDTISRQAAIAVADSSDYVGLSVEDVKKVTDEVIKGLKRLPSAEPEIIRCKDCIYGYLYIDVQNGITDSWIECRNPEGLNRDVSVDGYCSASIRGRRTDE